MNGLDGGFLISCHALIVTIFVLKIFLRIKLCCPELSLFPY